MTLENCQEMLNLSYNWDNEGAIPINIQCYAAAYRFAKMLNDNTNHLHPIEPELFPLSDGGIQVEFTWNNTYWEYEFDCAGHISGIYYESI